VTASAGQFVDVAGDRVYVQEWGVGQPLLCLHGLGGGGHFFSALGPLLGDRCRTIAMDFPGSGFSPRLSITTFDAFADLVVALVSGLKLANVTLLGHSMGTIVALEVIRRSPTLATRFIVVGGLPEPPGTARDRVSARVAAIKAHGMRGLGADAIAGNVSARTNSARPELTGLLARLFELQGADGYIATADALTGWTARPLPPLDHLKCLAITGEEDRYAAPDAVRRFARDLPDGTSVQVLRDCGHLPFLEQPAAFATTVEQFLTAV